MDTFSYKDLRTRSATFENPRILARSGLEKTHLRELALDIARRGLLYPLLITPEGVILGGQRRYLAIGMILDWEGELHKLTDHERACLDFRRAMFERSGVPVRVVEEEKTSVQTGLALADNLHRSQLSSFEIAERLSKLAETGLRGVELAQLIGKSKTYVSRALNTWRNATPRLRQAWGSGTLTYETVKAIANMPPELQPGAVARAEGSDDAPRPGPKGAHGRPGISAVQEAYARAHEIGDDSEAPYLRGVKDALGYVTGEPPNARFRALVGIPAD